MVYLLIMVIFHGYVSHNQMVTFGASPSAGHLDLQLHQRLAEGWPLAAGLGTAAAGGAAGH
jgi:hypothetical protein